jgi:nucleotide-binding universal stress UspA family protein
MNIQRVVFPVDFSDRSMDVCPYVAAVTERLQAKLTLLHVVETPAFAESPLDRAYAGEELQVERRQEKATQALNSFQSQYIPHVSSDCRVVVGDAATAIVEYAGGGDGAMIVMPTRGRGVFRQMLLGSVTAKVLHDSKYPVLTGPHLEKAIRPTEWLSLRRLLCSVSLDWETDRVLSRAAAFANQVGAELTVLHVISPVEESLLPLMDPGSPPLSTDSVTRTLQDALARNEIAANVCVRIGEVSRQVARAAREQEVDLVVIGRGGAPELPGGLGSHGYTIVRRAPCPVLSV